LLFSVLEGASLVDGLSAGASSLFAAIVAVCSTEAGAVSSVALDTGSGSAVLDGSVA